MLSLGQTVASPSSLARPMVWLHFHGPPRRLHTRQTAVSGATKLCEVRILTAEIKALLRRLTTSDKFLRWRSNQRNHERQMFERVMASFPIKYIPKQMLAFEEVPNLPSSQ